MYGTQSYSTEIENVLATHADVGSVTVVGLPHEKWGERVHVVIVLRPATAPDADSLATHCRASLAGDKFPRRFGFVEGPLSTAGEVLKNALHEMARKEFA